MCRKRRERSRSDRDGETGQTETMVWEKELRNETNGSGEKKRKSDCDSKSTGWRRRNKCGRRSGRTAKAKQTGGRF